MSSADRDMLVEAVERAFAEVAATGSDDDSAIASKAWSRIDELGIGNLLLPLDADGFGGTYQDLCAVMQSCGRHAVALPIGETIVARALLVASGAPLPAGPSSFGASEGAALSASAATSGIAFSGSVTAVPFGDRVETIVTIVRQQERSIVVCLDTGLAKRAARTADVAGQPVANYEFDRVTVRAGGAAACEQSLLEFGAALRVSQMAGAIDAVLRLAIEHATGRSQFGRRLSEFQVIQHQLAVLAEECAATTCAAMAMSRALDLGNASFEIAAAKLRANRAAGIATQLSHQIHGAIGCTREHRLHRLTRRLWSWRSEFGNDRHWALELGRQVVRSGADRFWAELTARGDRRARSSTPA